MSFCYNCGSRVEPGDRFCPACGAPVETISGEMEASMATNDSNAACGYLFTNLELLALKLKVTQTRIRKILEAYIKTRSQQGIFYSIVDVSCYEPKLAVNQVAGRVYQLVPEDDWKVYQRLLTDQYTYDTETNGKNVRYLFIIGGNDIIPMPELPHYINPGETIDSDLPYSFLYGKQTLKMLADHTLLAKPQMMHAGRLPVSPDMDISCFEAYLKRVIQVADQGIDFSGIYGQVDNSWKVVSSLITEQFRTSNCFVPSSSDDETYIYDSLVLTPDVTRTNIGQFFYPEASIYYFNMHGSDAPGMAGFYGIQNGRNIEGITPAELGSVRKPNVVVTEACYGARFIQKDAKESMLVSSINNQTVLFLGASRVAYGCTDDLLKNKQCPLIQADIMAGVFMHTLCMGYTAGEALMLARKDLLSTLDISNSHLVTLTEFNLFGDPALSIFPEYEDELEEEESAASMSILCAHAERIEVRTVYDCSGSGSLLDRLRQSVDRNMQEIIDYINQELYTVYGIKPRSLTRAFEIRSASGRKSMLYQFAGNYGNEILVSMNGKHQIIEILTSKI